MNVMDRIKAAEAASGVDKTENAKPQKVSKLRLNTDEHIKEEVLKRGDGGWQKKVGIGQQEKYQANTALPPVIKLTAETPVATMPPRSFPGKLSKGVPGAFESMPEESETPSKSWSRVEQMEAEQQARMDAEAAQEKHEWDRVARLEAEQQAAMDAEAAMAAKKSKKGAVKGSKQAPVKTNPQSSSRGLSLTGTIPGTSREIDDPVEPRRTSQARRERLASDARRAFVVEETDELEYESPINTGVNREQILFDPEDWAEKKQSRRERRVSSRQQPKTSLTVNENDRNRARSKSPSIRLFRINHDEDENDRYFESRKPAKRSGSRSAQRRSTEAYFSPPPSARRSSSFLWPSFSSSERKSSDDVFDTLRSRPSHARTRSDDRSISGSFVSDLSPRKLEFAEYVAGKRLSTDSLSPQRPRPRPMGFVRSRSHTGHYSEGYTRDKALLRKPDDDEVIEIVDHDWERHEHRHGRHHSSHAKEEPWQVRFITELARR